MHAEDGGPILVAALESRSDDGGKALFVMAADDPNALAQRRRRVLIDVSAAEEADGRMRVFRTVGSNAAFAPEVSGDGVIALPLKSNEAALIQLVEPSVQPGDKAAEEVDGFDDAWRSVAASDEAGILLNMPAEPEAATESKAVAQTGFDNQWRATAVSSPVDEILLGGPMLMIILR